MAVEEACSTRGDRIQPLYGQRAFAGDRRVADDFEATPDDCRTRHVGEAGFHFGLAWTDSTEMETCLSDMPGSAVGEAGFHFGRVGPSETGPERCRRGYGK